MGFVKEGTAREYLYREGRFWDKMNYSLLDAEYEKLYDENRIAPDLEKTSKGAGQPNGSKVEETV
jgi:hypothetical protein